AGRRILRRREMACHRPRLARRQPPAARPFFSDAEFGTAKTLDDRTVTARGPRPVSRLQQGWQVAVRAESAAGAHGLAQAPGPGADSLGCRKASRDGASAHF